MAGAAGSGGLPCEGLGCDAHRGQQHPSVHSFIRVFIDSALGEALRVYMNTTCQAEPAEPGRAGGRDDGRSSSG